MNPMDLMKLNGRMKLFQEQHPRFPLFIKEVGENALMAGSVVEMKVTTPDGREYITNVKLTPDDLETIGMAKNLR